MSERGRGRGRGRGGGYQDQQQEDRGYHHQQQGAYRGGGDYNRGGRGGAGSGGDFRGGRGGGGDFRGGRGGDHGGAPPRRGRVEGVEMGGGRGGYRGGGRGGGGGRGDRHQGPTGFVQPGHMSANDMAKLVAQLNSMNIRPKMHTFEPDNNNVAVPFQARPNAGIMGEKFPCVTNFFEVSMAKNLVLYQYNVEITHPYRKIPAEFQNHIFWQFIFMNRNFFPKPNEIIYDGSKIMFTLNKLKLPESSKIDEGGYRFETEAITPRDDNADRYHIQLRVVDSTVKFEFKNPEGRLNNLAMQALSVLFRQKFVCPQISTKLKWWPAGRGLYCEPDSAFIRENLVDDGYGNFTHCLIDLPGGRQIWRGLFQSIHIGDNWKPILNIDTLYSLFYKSRKNVKQTKEMDENGIPLEVGEKYSVLDFAYEIFRDSKNSQAQKFFHPQEMRANMQMSPEMITYFKAAIKKRKIYCTHRKPRMRKDPQTGQMVEDLPQRFEVKDVSLQGAHQLMFNQKIRSADGQDNGESRQISVAQYFQEICGEPLKYPRLPCLQVGNKKKDIYFPMEKCVIAAGCKYTRRIDGAETDAMIKVACQNAPKRQQAVLEIFKKAGMQNDPWLRTFGLNVSPNMIQVEARKLPVPEIEYGPRIGGDHKSNCRTLPDIKRGAWRLENSVSFLRGATISSWSIISFMSRNQQSDLEQFCTEMNNVAVGCGMKMEAYPEVVKYVQSPQVLRQAAEETLEESPKCELILIVIPGKGGPFTEHYNEAKRVSEIVCGVMTQCVQVKNVRARKPMTIANILLKLNAKMGGINHGLVPEPLTNHLLVNCPTLFLGIDVTHPPPGRSDYPSISAIVGNLDMTPFQFGATIQIQTEARETFVYLQDPVRDRLMEFYQRTKQKPRNIIVYRDGVDEGQFRLVLREEMAGMREACTKLSPDYKPAITMIVVQKRHHTRLFPKDMQKHGCGDAMNVPPGTVIDTGITSPFFFDFYLCSQFGIQGTSRPAHYYVLHDDANMNADQIQYLTYQLTHLYCRCTRPVSIPAPVYYAHLACSRARAHLYHCCGSESDSGSETASIRNENGATEALLRQQDQKLTVWRQSIRLHQRLSQDARYRMYFV